MPGTVYSLTGTELYIKFSSQKSLRNVIGCWLESGPGGTDQFGLREEEPIKKEWIRCRQWNKTAFIIEVRLGL